MTTQPAGRPTIGALGGDLDLVAVGASPAVPRGAPGGQIVFGRDAACDVVLPDEAVSRRHARLAWQDGVWWVQDLGSANGTLLSGVTVQQAVLEHGATLQIGPFRWTVGRPAPRRRWPWLDGHLVWRLTAADARAGAVDRRLWARQTVLGRNDTCDVVLPLAQVSALHARLERRRDGLHVTDLGSANGVRVGGEAVRSARLGDGDRFQIADLAFGVRRTWLPAPPALGAASLVLALLIVLSLLPTAGRRSLDLDRWWTREMYLEQAQRSLEEAVAAWQRPEPARELARANFAIALRSLAAVDFMPPQGASAGEVAAALQRAEIEFAGALEGRDLPAILAAVEASAAEPEPLAEPLAEPRAESPAEPAPAAAPTPYSLEAELALIMAEFGIDTASQPIPADLLAAIDRQVGFWTGEMQGFTRRAWRRGQEHLPMIEATLRQHRLPEVFSYLPFIESAFQTDVVSHAGARGLWQFMPGTARQYGLRVDDHVDERTDPIKATLAACQYLEYLLNAFGANSFMSAIAAYNKGEHGLLRCLGRGADWRSRWNFWDIATRGDGCLKQETIDYVPKFLGAAVVLRRPDVFVIEEGGA